MMQRTRLRFTRQRLGKFTKGTQLAYERVIYLPLDLAILYCAVQNFRLDLAKGFNTQLSEWENLYAGYIQEATIQLKEDGAGLYPGDNDEPWIHLKMYGVLPMPTRRMNALKEIFDILFERNDPAIFDSDLWPDPRTCQKDEAINALSKRVQRTMILH